MSIRRATVGTVGRSRRTNFWTGLALLMLVGGLSFSYAPAHSLAAAPSSASHAIAPLLLWAPLTITSYAAAPNPAFLNNLTTLSTVVSGGLPPYTYSYAGLPLGCLSSNTASLACTPTARGNSTVVLTVSDSGGNVTKNALVLRVNAFTISSFSVLPATDSLGSPVAFAATYGGAVGVVTWSWSGLPAGCTAPPGKAFTCTPTVAGTFTVTLVGTDSTLPTHATNGKSVTFTVTPVSITSFSVSPSTLYDGQSASFSTSITGTTGPVTYSYLGLPVGCTSQNLATLPCTPRNAGSFFVTVTAKDSAGDTSSSSTSLTVLPLTIVSFTASPIPTYMVIPTTLTVTAFGYLGLPTYSYSGLPPGCSSQNLPQIICKASAQGTYVVNATVSDPTGNHTSQLLSILVNPAAQPELYVPVSTSFSDPPLGQRMCYNTNNNPFYSSTCYLQSQDPSILTLPGGITGVGYAVYTNATSNTCAGARNNTNSQAAFSLSPNNGSTYTGTVLLGNTSSCLYLDSIEPAFAANRAGAIYGVFIEENSSATVLPAQYGVRTADALAFVSSLTGGVSFSAVRTLDASGNLARPAIAVFGQTIYIVYENLANSSTPIPGGGYLPIALKFLVSKDGGLTWSVPTTLPGQNASSGFNAMSPSIAVSASGEVAIAYATDRSCIAHSGAPATTPCLRYGSSVVVVTSATTNGTSWTGPNTASMNVPSGWTASGTAVIGPFLGETTCQAGGCLPFFFQGSPNTAIAFNGAGTKLFVAWTGTLNGSAAPNSLSWWRWSGVGVSGTANHGASWTGGIVAAPDGNSAPTVATNRTNYYQPAIGVSGSQLYLTYTADNETTTTSGIGKLYPGPFDNSYSQWVVNATIASAAASASLAWWAMTPVNLLSMPLGRLTNFTANSFTGFRSAVGINANGAPILGYTSPETPTTVTVSRSGYYSVNVTYATNLTIATFALVGMPQVVGVTFATSGLPPGQVWSFIIDNQVVTTNQSGILVLNVPKGVPVFLKQIPLTASWGVEIQQSGSFPSQTIFYANTTISITFSIWVELNITAAPTIASLVSAAGCGSFCYFYSEPYFYTYECLPVFGYTCTTVPATSTYSTCAYYFQVGCYYINMFSEIYYDQSGTTYVYTENYTYVNIYFYTATGQVSMNYNYNYYCYGNPSSPTCQHNYYVGNSAAYPWLPHTTATLPSYLYPMWVPLGIHLTYWANSYNYGFGASLPLAATYMTGTGVAAYNGPDIICNSICPQTWYTEYYYYYGTCSYGYAYNFCQTSPAETLNGPTNETLWYIPNISGGSNIITYPIEVIPVGLPKGTSYSFTLLGTVHTATSPTAVFLPNVPAGNTTITGAFAAGTSPGWEYFAPPTAISVPTSVFVNLYFNTSIDFAAPVRSVSLNELNLATGTPWTIDFNGTLYASTTTSIGVVVHPGNYSLVAYKATSPSGDAIYTPTYASSVPFVTQTAYTISYAGSFQLSASASAGGTVAIAKGKASGFSTAWVAGGAKVNLTATPLPNYQFLGWTGIGAGSYTGLGTASGSQFVVTLTMAGPVVESASFALLPQARYDLSFTSTGLPNGVWWTVFLNNGQGPVGYSTNHTTLTVPNEFGFSAPNKQGLYKMTVGFAYVNGTSGTRYVPGGFPATVATNGTLSAIPISWSAQYQLVLAATPGGAVAGAIGSVAIAAGAYWVSSGQIVTAQATVPDPAHYKFVGWNGTGPGAVPSALAPNIQLIPTGPVTEVAQFIQKPYVPPAQFTVEFLLGTTVAPGTVWSIAVGSAQFSSATSVLNATGLVNGTYAVSVKTAYAPGGLTRYVPNSHTITNVGVAGADVVQRVVFDPQYWVSIGSSVGGTVTAAVNTATGGAAVLSGWYPQNTVLVLTATPSPNYLFVTWSGTAASADAVTTVPVNQPVHEVASFEPPVPIAKTQAGFIGSTTGWIAFAVIGLVVGLAVGLLIVRMASRPRAPPPSGGGAGPEESMEPAPSEGVYGSEPLENPGGDQ